MFKRNFVRLACLTVVVAGLVVPCLQHGPGHERWTAGTDGLMSLQAPPFANVARAAEDSPMAFDLAQNQMRKPVSSAYFQHRTQIIVAGMIQELVTVGQSMILPPGA